VGGGVRRVRGPYDITWEEWLTLWLPTWLALVAAVLLVLWFQDRRKKK
jgi:predicted signal transduction protein with EAL and GGDEF domain